MRLREARIDLARLGENVRTLRRLVAPAELLVVVKADGYGHGAVLAARAAVEAGADRLGVADIDEALELRAAGITAPILSWLHGPDADFAAAVAAGIELGISSTEQLEAAVAVGAPSVQVKLDTGLSRNGVAPDEWPALAARIAEHVAAGRLRLSGMFSHLSTTDRAEDLAQLARFEELVQVARRAGLESGLRHLAASSAAIDLPAAHLDAVRVGIAVYGLPPAPGVDLAALGIRPVMELAATVVALRRVDVGAGVSYGYQHRAERPTTLALVPLGYADGIPRIVSGRGAEVAIGGRRHPVVGRVAMDQIIVDVGDAPVAVGDRAIVWGDPATGAPSAEEWAGWAGTIGYEIVTRVGPRVPRIAVGQ